MNLHRRLILFLFFQILHFLYKGGGVYFYSTYIEVAVQRRTRTDAVA